MTVEWSVSVNASAGTNTVNLPSAGVLIGVFHQSQYLSIQIDPSHVAVIPGRGVSNLKPAPRPYLPVYWALAANSFQFYVPSAGLVVFYFGQPDSDAVPLSALVGVVGTVSLQNSGTSPATLSSSVGFNFLSRTQLVGVLLQPQDGNAQWCQVSFAARPGYSVTVGVDWSMGLSLSLDSVVPLANVPVAQSLQVAVSALVNASATAGLYVIFYYRVV